MAASVKKVSASFTKSKETKGTIVYKEDKEESQVIGSLYIQKEYAAKLGNPDTITVTVEAK